VNANLAELRARIAGIEKAGRPVGASLQNQLTQANQKVWN